MERKDWAGSFKPSHLLLYKPFCVTSCEFYFLLQHSLYIELKIRKVLI